MVRDKMTLDPIGSSLTSMLKARIVNYFLINQHIKVKFCLCIKDTSMFHIDRCQDQFNQLLIYYDF